MQPMCSRSQFRVVQLTPPGRGAIATVLVEGPRAVEALDRQFRARGGRPLRSRPAGQLVVGRFGPEPAEEVVLRRRSDESVELHCHGGHAAVAMVEGALVEQGGQAVAWQDWVVDHHRDPITAAAHAALAEAPTARTAGILLDQYHGALRRALEEIEWALRRQDARSARAQIEALWARADLGRHLTRPWRVVLGGGANVGKSSLINALVGYRRAIVHRTPGTTRDVLGATTAVDGWPIELSDTAGFDPTGDARQGKPSASGAAQRPDTAGWSSADEALRRAGIRRAGEKLRDADLAVLVFDASVPWSAADRGLVAGWPDGLIVHNKSDVARSGAWRPPGISASARTGEGIDALGRAIADRLVPDPPPPGAAVPFTPEQLEQLGQYRPR